MKDRISKSKTAKTKETKSIWLSKEEWKRVGNPVKPDKRVGFSINLKLTPIQHQALHEIAGRIFITPEEMIISALVYNLDHYNNDDENAFRAFCLGGVLNSFPERKKELGLLCKAYDAADNATNLASNISLSISAAMHESENTRRERF